MSRLLKPGDTLGKYEIVQELAVGGMAAIYLAKVTGTAGFEKNVVLKCILPTLATDRVFVNMFLDEARLAATLRHSNIADVFDVGADGTNYYFAMEYVAGQNARQLRLEAKKKNVAIPIEIALATVLGTTAALAYAHGVAGPNGPLDLVHRDVSPSNILVSYEGAVKLVDFGIARASSRSAKTRTGMRKGKVPYMSPEQCRGLTVDRRSDLFSLGTVLYELTTPQRPFTGNSDFEVMEAIVGGHLPPPSKLVPGYPPMLEQIVLRLLANEPAARYPTANEALEALEQFVSQNGILTSAHVVARFMRELFLNEAPTTPRSYPSTDDLDFLNVPTAQYPTGKPPTGLVQTLKAADEEETNAFKRAEHLWSPEMKVKVRTPREPHGDEASMTSPFAERTNQDIGVPFDPIDARSEEILRELDNDAPPNEAPNARAYRRVDTLVHQAMAWMGLGEADKAVASIELALDEDTSYPEVQQLLQKHVDTIVSVYEALLDDPYRQPRLTRSLPELVGVPMEADARVLLPLIDGVATIQDILARSGMHRLEVYHHLCQLVLRGIMT